MQIRHITPSAQIYIDQLNNYISTGEGYKQIRVLLLKQLNSIDADNHSSDQTLVPALMQNLRRKLMEDSSEEKSRAIDVLQDIITYADQVVQSYTTSQMYCISFHSVITYKLFNPFSKAIFDQNRQRLLSILLHYYSKFQSNPNRYLHIFKTFKQLKQRGYQFPQKSFINYPKVNQFKSKLTKTLSQKSAQSDRIGVTFDSIIEFVNDCQKQFNANKNSCANTQFVRALKVKAKTLFDLSQNTQGIDLNTNQKQHAKQLYKQIRTILKQIEKISEQKIKQQKIKNEKEFTQQKIQQMTPKKKQKQSFSDTKKQQQTTTGNLLDDIAGQQQQKPVPYIGVKTPSMKKTHSLLDDNNDQQFTQFVTSNVQQLSIKKSVSSSQQSKQVSGSDGPKPLKKPPKYNDTQSKEDNISQIKEDILIETVQPKKITPKKNISQQQQHVQLIQTVQITSIKSKKSLNSQQSDKAVKLIQQPENMSPSKSNKNVIDFQNQQHFSRFQIVNTLTSKIMDPNVYNVIPHDIDFSDSSSQSGNRVTFEINKNQTFFDNQPNKHYDHPFLTPKKQSSQLQRVSEHVARSQQDLERMSSSANYQLQQQSELIPNYNFGILADTRQVKAYDYCNIPNVNRQRSMSNLSQEQERKIAITPQNIKKPSEPMSMKQLSPNNMEFNSQEKKPAHQLMTGKDDDEQQFNEFQQVQQTIQVKELKKESLIDKIVSKLQQNGEQILVEHSPQKGKLIKEDESPILTKELFL